MRLRWLPPSLFTPLLTPHVPPHPPHPPDVTMAVKPPQQPQQQPASKGQPKLLIPDEIAKSASEPVHKGPLRNVVANAVRRWYYEAAVEASKGDTVRFTSYYGWF